MFSCIPMIKISDADISVQENRNLEKQPHLFTAGGLNSKFPSEFFEC